MAQRLGWIRFAQAVDDARMRQAEIGTRGAVFGIGRDQGLEDGDGLLVERRRVGGTARLGRGKDAG